MMVKKSESKPKAKITMKNVERKFTLMCKAYRDLGEQLKEFALLFAEYSIQEKLVEPEDGD